MLTQALANGTVESVAKVVMLPTNLTVTEGTSSGRQDIQAVDFVFSVGSLSAPYTMTFTNTSENATSNVWNFGDGATITSNASPIMHTYTAAGNYHVVLTSSNAGGTDTTGANIILN